MIKFLVIGLGSMGKRRIRCLQYLGYKEIAGFDLRSDRRLETEKKYNIMTFHDIKEALYTFSPDCFIISVPPDKHSIYMKLAVDNEKHFFVEASVLDTDYEEIKVKLKNLDLVAAPSATMLFHPAIKQIKEIINSGELGKISNIIFHSGQYLPDWHTYEKVSDFYVSNPLTGGAREIVPFELTWITHIFGFPKMVCGNVRKTINIKGAEKIDDTYNILLDYESFLATITVDVVSRYATRRLLLNGDKKQLLWDWNLGNIQIYDPETDKWYIREYEMMNSAEGYNPNIGENMYIDELKAFIDAIKGEKPFVNTLDNDHNILKLLYKIEESSKTHKFMEINI